MLGTLYILLFYVADIVCRGCIVRRLSSGVRACPVCNIMTSPPLIPDTCLQRLVYLTVPGLFRSELERRRYFRLVNPQCPPLIPPLGALALTLDDFVSLSLQELEESENEARERGVPTGRDDISTCRPEEYDGELTDLESEKSKDSASQGGSMRYLKCPAAVTIRHLIRLLMLKRGWEETTATIQGVNRIEIIYQQNNLEHGNKDNKMQPLDTSWTLLDLACIFQWKGVSNIENIQLKIHTNTPRWLLKTARDGLFVPGRANEALLQSTAKRNFIGYERFLIQGRRGQVWLLDD